MEIFILYVFLITLNTAYVFSAFYEHMSFTQPKYEQKQKSGLSKMQCIGVCERKKLVASLQKGECICLKNACGTNGKTDGSSTDFVLFMKKDSTQNQKCEIESESTNELGADSSNPAKSCKQIKENNPSLTISGFYWIKLDQPTRVYCDMVTDGGGWMMIGNVTSTNETNSVELSYTYLSENTNSSSFQILSEVNNGRTLFNMGKFAELDGYIDFKQYRIFCTKPYHQRIFHMMTKLNPIGEAYKKILTEQQNTWKNLFANGCNSTFSALPDDNSYLKTSCLKNKAFGNGYGLYYYNFMYDYGNYYIAFNFCDDLSSSTGSNFNYGAWYYFVR